MSSDILQKQKVFREKLTGKLFCVRSIMRLKVVGSLRGGEEEGGDGGKGEVGEKHLILGEKYGRQQDLCQQRSNLNLLDGNGMLITHLGQYEAI